MSTYAIAKYLTLTRLIVRRFGKFGGRSIVSGCYIDRCSCGIRSGRCSISRCVGLRNYKFLFWALEKEKAMRDRTKHRRAALNMANLFDYPDILDISRRA